MLASQKLAIAAHIHVLLRRKTGRVTDTEWMASNLEYAMEIVRFARAKAQEDGHPDLAEWASKLEQAALDAGPKERTPLAQSAAQALRNAAADPNTASSNFGSSTFSESGFTESSLEGDKRKPRDANVPRYVGGIR